MSETCSPGWSPCPAEHGDAATVLCFSMLETQHCTRMLSLVQHAAGSVNMKCCVQLLTAFS